ncbi:MAG TPA: DUF308 domain-containing protein [Acidimicrobiia bacterium]|nr:DUF308 domain-containing protein [Acidimicrobiia bacterium]
MLNPIARPNDLDREVAEVVSKGWWILFVSGLVSAVAGVVILSTDWTVGDLALFVAILFVVRGALQAAAIPLDGSGRGWNVFVGIVEILVGIAFLSWPDVGLYTLAVFIGAWVVVSGAFDFVGAIAHRHDVSMWWLFLVVGVVELALGIAMLDRPALTLAIAITVVGIWALVAGMFQIVTSFEVKNLPHLIDRMRGA